MSVTDLQGDLAKLDDEIKAVEKAMEASRNYLEKQSLQDTLQRLVIRRLGLVQRISLAQRYGGEHIDRNG